MVKIKHSPAKKRNIELSIGEQVVHNSFYLPRRQMRSKIYRGYETYEGFGYGPADKAGKHTDVPQDAPQQKG